MIGAQGCEAKFPQPPTPPGVEITPEHPRYGHLLDRANPRLYCDLPAGHDGAHRAGTIIFHDPPLILVGGERRAAA